MTELMHLVLALVYIASNKVFLAKLFLI